MVFSVKDFIERNIDSKESAEDLKITLSALINLRSLMCQADSKEEVDIYLDAMLEGLSNIQHSTLSLESRKELLIDSFKNCNLDSLKPIDKYTVRSLQLNLKRLGYF